MKCLSSIRTTTDQNAFVSVPKNDENLDNLFSRILTLDGINEFVPRLSTVYEIYKIYEVTEVNHFAHVTRRTIEIYERYGYMMKVTPK